MILLLDIGNSLCKWRVAASGRMRGEGALPSRDLSVGSEPPWHEWPVTRAAIANVAGDSAREAVQGWLEQAGVECHWLMPGSTGHGIRNGYRQPERLGADRYAALVAARRRLREDCVVACVGTAVTVDGLLASGEFVGGCIVPGPGAMAEALAVATAQVRATGVAASRSLPRDTGEAVASGVAWALAGLVEQVRGRLPGATSRQIPVLLSGGARGVLAGCLKAPVREVDNIVLEGLEWIARDLGYDA